jgi:hypothetical protein
MRALVQRIVTALSPVGRAQHRHREELLRVHVSALRDRAELERQATRTQMALLELARRANVSGSAEPTKSPFPGGTIEPRR